MLQQDLAAVRDLCVKLDQARDSLTRQLATKSEDETQVEILFCFMLANYCWTSYVIVESVIYDID